MNGLMKMLLLCSNLKLYGGIKIPTDKWAKASYLKFYLKDFFKRKKNYYKA